jgi:hypothetical protein
MLSVSQMTATDTRCDPGNDRDPESMWMLVDENNDQTPEHALSETYKVDFKPPELDEAPSARGAEGGFTASWALNESEENVLGFQILCARASGGPVFPTPPTAPLYLTSRQLCGASDPVLSGGGGGGSPDAGVIDAGALDGGIDAPPPPDAAPPGDAPTTGASLTNLDPSFVCSGSISPTETSARVSLPAEVASAGEEVDVYVAIVDEHRNVSIRSAGRVKAEPVVDFWETYVAQGGGAKGGFCAAAPGGRRSMGAVIALAAVLILLGRRPRSARALLALVLLGPAAASGQVVLDDEAEQDPTHVPSSAWVFELKFGPYYPQIDGEEGVVGKPFETTFGSGQNFLTQIELDRFFLWPFGQLGVGASAGYMQDTARAFAQDAAGNPIFDQRSADKTAFHLVPTAFFAVYRFTELADRTPVPLVPYGKLGLSYYIWWVTRGDGSVSSRAPNGDGYGGTWGWQGTIGLALRADQIDPGAVRSLTIDYGIEHASFFAELTHADVSGLGSDEKLHVGDTTWAAGVNFEF